MLEAGFVYFELMKDIDNQRLIILNKLKRFFLFFFKPV